MMVFIVSKIFTFLILPPGLFLTLIFLGLLFIAFKKRRLGYLIFLFVLFFGYAITMEPVADFLLKPLENTYPPLPLDTVKEDTIHDAKIDIDYIVVLGGGVISSSPAAKGKGTLSPDSLKRHVFAALLHKKTDIPLIVTGGVVYPSRDKQNVMTELQQIEIQQKEPEGKVAKRQLMQLGVPEENIIMETKSNNTWENAVFVKQNYNPETILLVTSAYHMPRSVFCFKSQCINTIPAPTDYKTERVAYTWKSFFPTFGALEKSYHAFHELAGIVFYRILH